jgi:hypothetical protein
LTTRAGAGCGLGFKAGADLGLRPPGCAPEVRGRRCRPTPLRPWRF